MYEYLSRCVKMNKCGVVVMDIDPSREVVEIKLKAENNYWKGVFVVYEFDKEEYGDKNWSEAERFVQETMVNGHRAWIDEERSSDDAVYVNVELKPTDEVVYWEFG